MEFALGVEPSNNPLIRCGGESHEYWQSWIWHGNQSIACRGRDASRNFTCWRHRHNLSVRKLNCVTWRIRNESVGRYPTDCHCFGCYRTYSRSILVGYWLLQSTTVDRTTTAAYRVWPDTDTPYSTPTPLLLHLSLSFWFAFNGFHIMFMTFQSCQRHYTPKIDSIPTLPF